MLAHPGVPWAWDAGTPLGYVAVEGCPELSLAGWLAPPLLLLRRGCGVRAVVPKVFSREGGGGGRGGALVGRPGGSVHLLEARCLGLASREVTVASAALAGRLQTEKDSPAWGQGSDPPAQSGAGGQARAREEPSRAGRELLCKVPGAGSCNLGRRAETWERTKGSSGPWGEALAGEAARRLQPPAVCCCDCWGLNVQKESPAGWGGHLMLSPGAPAQENGLQAGTGGLEARGGWGVLPESGLCCRSWGKGLLWVQTRVWGPGPGIARRRLQLFHPPAQPECPHT